MVFRLDGPLLRYLFLRDLFFLHQKLLSSVPLPHFRIAIIHTNPPEVRQPFPPSLLRDQFMTP